MSNQALFPVTQSTPSDLVKLAGAVASSSPGSGGQFIRFDKQGDWTLGAERTPIDVGDLFAVNPYSFMMGYVHWENSAKVGEVMRPADQFNEIDRTQIDIAVWDVQQAVSMRLISEELDLEFSTSSRGGRKLIAALGQEISQQVMKDIDHPVPVIKLTAGGYQHKKYGWIHEPEFEITDWLDMDGKPAAKRKLV